MRNVSLRIAAVVAALAVAAPAAATNGMRMIGFGPVQDSMGGASAALPLDSSTIISNPAGMSALDRRVDLSGTAFMPSPSYTSDAGSGNSISSDRPTDFIPTLGAIYRTTENAVGVAAMGTTGADQGGPFEQHVTSHELPPRAGGRLQGHHRFVGVAANLMYAQMEYAASTRCRSLRDLPARSATARPSAPRTARRRTSRSPPPTRPEPVPDFQFDIPEHDQVVGPTRAATHRAPFPAGTEKPCSTSRLLTPAPLHPIEAFRRHGLPVIRWSTTNGGPAEAPDGPRRPARRRST
jgi:long-chain fatty acid transport protein